MFRREKKPQRHYPYGFGYARIVLPIASIVVGLGMALTSIPHLGQRGESNATLISFIGLGLVVFGVIALFVARWMARRGL